MEKLIKKYALFHDLEELDIIDCSQSSEAFYVLVRLEPSAAQKGAFSSCVKTEEGNHSLQIMHADLFNPTITKGFLTNFLSNHLLGLRPRLNHQKHDKAIRTPTA